VDYVFLRIANSLITAFFFELLEPYFLFNGFFVGFKGPNLDNAKVAMLKAKITAPIGKRYE